MAQRPIRTKDVRIKAYIGVAHLHYFTRLCEISTESVFVEKMMGGGNKTDQ